MTTDGRGRFKAFEDFAQRAQLWFFFPVVVPFLPFLALGFNRYMATASGGIWDGLHEVLYSGELLLISTALVAGAIADSMVAARTGGYTRIIDIAIVAVGINFVIAGSLAYALIAPSAKEEAHSHSHQVATLSVVAFVLSLLIGVATIWRDTSRERRSVRGVL